MSRSRVPEITHYPVIPIHIDNPFILSNHYYQQISNEPLNTYVRSILLSQYHTDLQNAFMDGREKMERLSILGRCLNDLDHMNYCCALEGAGFSIHESMHLSFNATDVLKKAAGTVKDGLVQAGKSMINMKDAASNVVNISREKKLITEKLESIIKNLSAHIRNISGFEEEWTTILNRMRRLNNPKAAPG